MSVEQEKTPQAIWDELEAEDRAAQGLAPAETASKPVEAEPAAKTEEPKQPQPVSAQPSPLEKQVSELTHLVKTTMGRVGALQGELQKIGTMAASRVAEAPSQRQIDAAVADPEKWKKMRDDFPDWAEAIDEFVSSRIKVGSPPVSKDEITQVARSVVESAIPQRIAETAEDLLDTVRDNWKSELSSPEFKAWFYQQPEHYRVERGTSNKASVVLKTLREFDAFSEAQKARAADEAKQQGAKSKRLAAAAMPSGVTPPPTKSTDEMSDTEYWNYLEEQDRRRAQA